MNLKIDKISIKYLLLFMGLFTPDYIIHICNISRLFDIVKLCVFLYCLADMIYSREKVNRYILWIGVFEAYIFLITVFNSADIFTIIKQAVIIFSTVYLVCRLGKRDYWLLIRTLSFMMNTYMLINTITLFLYPDAMYLTNRNLPECWFLGLDNTAVVYYVIGNILSIVYNHKYGKKIWPAISVLQTIIFVFRNDIVTGKVCLAAMLLLLVLSYVFKKLFAKIDILKFSIVDIILMFMVIFMNSSAFFSDFAMKYLGRSGTFSNRTTIWNRALQLIKQKPIFGYGTYDGDSMSQIIGLDGITSAHNYYFMILFWGGIVALVLFVMILVVANKGYEKSFTNTVLAIGVFVLMFRAIVETGGYELIFIMISVYYAQCFARNNSDITGDKLINEN